MKEELHRNGIHEATFEEIEQLKGFDECVESYKTFCTNPDIAPEVCSNYDWYRRNPSNLHCFVVTHDDRCVGFCSLLFSYYPHLNVNFAVTESLFIQQGYRGKYWNLLLQKLKGFAKRYNCAGIMIGAGANSRFEKYMKMKYPAVNTLFWVKTDDE